MMELAIGAVILLIVATIAVFVVLISVNIALFLKLRSSIPQQPFSDSES